MSTSATPPDTISGNPWSTQSWTRRLVIGLAVLAWVAITGILFWLVGLIAFPIMVFIISIIIAYILYPLVKLLRRFMHRAIAILFTYLLVLAVAMLIIYYVLLTSIVQLISLVQQVQKNIPAIMQRLQPVVDALQQAGINPQQLQGSASQLMSQLLSLVGQLLPLALNIFSLVITAILITSLSIYFIVDGPRIAQWLRAQPPRKQRAQISYFLTTLNRIVGSFLRGQILSATITTTIMGIGLYVIGVPYAMLLALVIFIFEFVPQIGSYISAAIIVLFALATSGWQIALIVAVFSSIVQAGIGGQILTPRILGGAVGLHPIVSILALLIGATLFGLPGAIFAAPVAGILQIFLVSAWRTWKQGHPQDFSDEPVEQQTGDQGSTKDQ